MIGNCAATRHAHFVLDGSGPVATDEFDVRDMPVTVAVDATGTSVHQTGPKEWQARIGKIPVSAT
jgi:fumarate hydratase class I